MELPTTYLKKSPITQWFASLEVSCLSPFPCYHTRILHLFFLAVSTVKQVAFMFIIASSANPFLAAIWAFSFIEEENFCLYYHICFQQLAKQLWYATVVPFFFCTYISTYTFIYSFIVSRYLKTPCCLSSLYTHTLQYSASKITSFCKPQRTFTLEVYS